LSSKRDCCADEHGVGRRRALLTIASALVLPAMTAVRVGHAEIGTQFQLESDLTCQCGCGLTVHSCNHLNCGSGIPLKKEVADQLATGKSREEILAYFQKKYGEKILSSPTTEGFNILAWTMPFVVVGAGALLIILALGRWNIRRTDKPGPSASSDDGVQERLRRELETEVAQQR
jgi:cytochrome c-type biogenesis protein CcmH